MTRRYFVISDTHFGHTKCWDTFKLSDGSPLRNFTSTEEMDQHMIDRWNSVVRDDDVVFHLGDVVINRKFLHKVRALKGVKRLVRGNHDLFPLQEYLDVGFEEVYGVIKHPKYPFFFSHIPLHPGSVPRWCTANIHGHLHGKAVIDKWGKRDPRYICVSVENVNYTPVDLDEVMAYVESNDYYYDAGSPDESVG